MANNSSIRKKTRYTSGGTTEVFPTRLGWWERYVFERQRDDIEYTLETKYDKRPDLLSYDVYGTPNYMWTILQFNNILDINMEFVTGKTIMLPTPTRVQTEL